MTFDPNYEGYSDAKKAMLTWLNRFGRPFPGVEWAQVNSESREHLWDQLTETPERITWVLWLVSKRGVVSTKTLVDFCFHWLYYPESLDIWRDGWCVPEWPGNLVDNLLSWWRSSSREISAPLAQCMRDLDRVYEYDALHMSAFSTLYQSIGTFARYLVQNYRENVPAAEREDNYRFLMLDLVQATIFVAADVGSVSGFEHYMWDFWRKIPNPFKEKPDGENS